MTSLASNASLASAFSITSSTVYASIATISSSTSVGLNASIADPQQPLNPPDDGGKCHLLGPFAILVQGALGALALLSLVYKRWRERPQRPVKIWAFDVSKQVFGTVLLHMANLVMSMFSAGEIEAQIAKAAVKTVGATVDEDWRPNPCSFYLLNLGIDTTLGIPILLLILKVLHAGASKTPLANPPESIKSGYYGDPPKVSWWLKQSMLYFFGLIGMKACVFIIFQLCPWIVIVGDWALKWTEGNTALQIAFVMLIFPLIMNAFQYYVIDTFIKKKPDADEAGSQHTRNASEGESGGLLAGDEHAQDDDNRTSVEEGLTYKVAGRTSPSERLDQGRLSDDNNRRHEGDTGAASSSSSATMAERDSEQQRLAPKIVK